MKLNRIFFSSVRYLTGDNFYRSRLLPMFMLAHISKRTPMNADRFHAHTKF